MRGNKGVIETELVSISEVSYITMQHLGNELGSSCEGSLFGHANRSRVNPPAFADIRRSPQVQMLNWWIGIETVLPSA
jgi:hypothetical protein